VHVTGWRDHGSVRPLDATAEAVGDQPAICYYMGSAQGGMPGPTVVHIDARIIMKIPIHMKPLYHGAYLLQKRFRIHAKLRQESCFVGLNTERLK
jgi:hypothetical protein